MPGERTSCTNLVRSWVNPLLGHHGKRKTFWLGWELNWFHGHPARHTESLTYPASWICCMTLRKCNNPDCRLLKWLYFVNCTCILEVMVYLHFIFSIGVYNTCTPKRPNQFRHSFGGHKVSDSGGDVKCCPLNVDVCSKCGKQPYGDYWHLHMRQFLCRSCKSEEDLNATRSEKFILDKYRVSFHFLWVCIVTYLV